MFSDVQVTFSARKESFTFKTILAQSYGLWIEESPFSEIHGSFS